MQVHLHTHVCACVKPLVRPWTEMMTVRGENGESKENRGHRTEKLCLAAKLLSLARNAFASGLQDELPFHNAASAPVIFYFVPPSFLDVVIGGRCSFL